MKKRARKTLELRRAARRLEKRSERAAKGKKPKAHKVVSANDGARLGAMLLTGTFAVAYLPVYAAGSLPVPCGAGAACIGGTGKALGFDPLGTASTLVNSLNKLTINQNANSAIFNWASFNISPGNTVQFIQPSTSSVALNRIFDPNVTTISGNLIANGQIYLINPNGMLFGSGANVNVAGLIASTSNVANFRVTSGLLSDYVLTDPVFTNNAAVLGASAAASPVANSNATPAIVVQPGATLYAAGEVNGTIVSAGRVFLFAPTVENGGNITVDGGGQVILAAGSDIYLGSSTNAALRGLLVEVAGSTSAVSIDATGNITVPHGNITLMGLAVNQAGTLSATTALDANGSIYLEAREASTTGGNSTTGVSVTNGADPSVILTVGQTGTVNLASGSKTLVNPDPTDTATAPLNDPTADSLNSTIVISGGAVNIGGNGTPGSTLVQAHGGTVTVTARQASSQVSSEQTTAAYSMGDGSLLGASDLSNPNGMGNINVGADAEIDVSGVLNAAVDGGRNFVYVSRLTSTNLANAPYQRTGFLLGQGVWVDLNEVPSWLNLSSLQQAVAGTQAERDSVGGTVALRAEGTVNLSQGSVINVSGGSTDVSAAQGRTSLLISATGQEVDISNASATTQYVGFADQGSYTATDTNEGVSQTVGWQSPNVTQQGGYIQGSNAGTVELYASAANLAGTLLGKTITGINQRSVPALGAELKIGSDNATNLDSEAGIQRPNILLAATGQELGQGLSSALASSTSGPTIVLNATALTQGGFNRFDLTSDGAIELAPGSPLNLASGGQFTARANAIEIDSSITAPGGSVSLLQRPLTPLAGGDGAIGDEISQHNYLNLVALNSPEQGLIDVASGVQISTAGLWTNDAALASGTVPTSPIVLNGGAISLSATNVDVAGASFDVSAGAWLSQTGQFSGGTGGSLSLAALPLAPAVATAPTAPQLDLGSDFSSHIAGYGAGLGEGGSLSLTAWSLQLGFGSSSDASVVVIDPAVGTRGFQSFYFTGYQEANVSPGTVFGGQPTYFQSSPGLLISQSAGNMLAVTTPQAPLPGETSPLAVSIKASDPVGGSVDVGQGALLDAGVQGSIQLTGFDNLLVEGTLRAQAGSIALALGSADQSGTNYPFTLATLQSRSIQLGPDALVDVSGVSLVTLQSNGLKTGNVLNAGSVSVDAPLGTVAMDPGARILANGASDTVDILGAGGQYVPQVVASAGGQVEMSAGNALYVEGQINARGGSAGANGGSLSVELVAVLPGQGDSDPNVTTQLGLPTNLTISSSLPLLQPAQASFPVVGEQAVISPATIIGSGFEQVWLQSADTITLANSMSLGSHAGGPSSGYSINSLVLSSQALLTAPGADVSLNAGTVMLGPTAQLSLSTNGNSNFQGSPPAGTSGTGSLTVNAQQIDLVGALALQGIGQTTLNATGDIVAMGVQNNTNPSRFVGSLSFGGNLALNAAQFYPATQTDYTISFAPTGTAADATNGQVQVALDPQAGAVLPPISAGGSLTFNVNSFTSSGRVEAPQGQIAINADLITLAPGSELSITGQGLVPYGDVFNGTTWTYGVPASNSIAIDPYTIASSAGTALPSKGISLNAPAGSVDAQAGAIISIAGGGDVLGTGFVAGPGGSYDYSQNFPFGTSVRNPFFALIPSRGAAPAPYDPQTYSNLVLDTGLASVGNATFAVGETITIAQGSGIPAGTYTIMPARYALLPGAYAVEAVTGYAGISPTASQPLPDGTVVVAGKLGFADVGTSASLWSAFRIYSNSQFNTLSQFEEYYGSQYFAEAAVQAGQVAQRLGQDAGVLQVDAAAILLASSIDAAPAAGGRGAEIAINAPSIVVGNFSTPSTTPQSTVDLDAGMLAGLGAETLILGATDANSLAASPSSLASFAGNLGTIVLTNPVATQSVSVQATNTPLSAGQVLLAASNVSVASGATIASASNQNPPTTAVNATGDGAMLYVGNVATPPVWTRSGASPAGTATTGSLSIATGALIEGTSVLFDATATQSFGAGLAIQASSVDLSSSVINLGAAPASVAGLDLTGALLDSLASAKNLTLTSTGGVDVYGTAALGQQSGAGVPSLGQLTLIGPGISGFGAATDSLTITAGHVTLENLAGATIDNAGTGSGSLAINTTATGTNDGSIAVAGTVILSGFSSVALSATGRAASATQTASGTGDLFFAGSVGSLPALVVQGTSTSLAIDSTRITAQRGVDASITVPGALTIAATGPAQAPEQSELGASLSISAQNVDMAGRIDLPAGVVNIAATGPATTDGITLESGSSIRVAGVTQTFGSTTADVSAGGITLASANGSIMQNSGATLDLSGAGSQGDAGSLTLAAPASGATVSLNGTVLAVPGTAAAGANFMVDAGSIASLSALVQTFNTATGTAGSNSIDVRARTGNLTVAAGDAINASNIVLEADGGGGATDGSISIAGTLNASGNNGGNIGLYANYQVELQTGASLNASATGANGSGGEVLISSRIVANPATSLDAIVLQAGSTIAVGGNGIGNGGIVVLRAPQVVNTAGTPDVAITAAAGSTVSGTLNDAATTQTGINEEIVEAVHVYSAADNALIAANPNVVLDPTMPAGSLLTTVQADAQTFMSAAQSGIAARLAALGSFSLRPGIEVDTTGTIVVQSSSTAILDFASTDPNTGAYLWRYGGTTLASSTPGVLTLRAGGAINVATSISDGFNATAPGSALNSTVATAGDSWSYTLTAGADLSAADPNRTTLNANQPAANLVVGTESAASPVTIRTGTGSIALNASQDVVLDNGASQQANVVYTAGVADVANLPAFPTLTATANKVSQTISVAANITQYGGSVSIEAGRDVLGTAEDGSNTSGSTQTVNEWLMRGGLATAAAPTVWFVDFAQFQQGFGALGGGNLTIDAGRNLVQVGAVVPSNGYDTGAGISERNSGALNVTAGGAVEQGLFYDEAGAFDLTATSFTNNPNVVGSSPPKIAQGSNEVIVQARESAYLMPSFNPTLVDPSLVNIGNSTNKALDAAASWQTQFLTFTSATTMDVQVAAGDLTLGQMSGGDPATMATHQNENFYVTAPNLQMVAFGGSIQGNGSITFGAPVPDSPSGITLAPSSTGQLRLLADQSIDNLSVVMSQADPSLVPQVSAPGALAQAPTASLQAPFQGNNGASLHASDPNIAEVVARNGSIYSDYLNIPKTAEIAAGGYVGGSLSTTQPTDIHIQNDNGNSLSIVSGGQGISFTNGSYLEGITVDGPGALQIVSGGPINLGSAGVGIVSRGNLDNPNLNPTGASLIVVSGAGTGVNGLAALPDYVGAITNFVQYDAFASMGSAAASLNQQVVAALATDSSLAPLVTALQVGLSNRSSATNPTSQFSQELAQLSPEELAVGAVKLASAIQVVNNSVFVASNNSDTFAPAYVAFGDLFPNVMNYDQAIRQFVLNNVFANSGEASTLQAQALLGLPATLASVIELGLAAPGTVNQPSSAFSAALAALDLATLQGGTRQLMANVLSVAGASEEQLAASGRLTGTGSPYAKALTALAQAFAPSTPAGLDDIQMDYNEINVEQSGNATFFAPQGAVIVGQSSPPTFTAAKTPAQLGIFTYGGGDIIGMARDSIDVYQSRVFTVAGGDIDLWSSLADLDAGRGPRDVAVVPPPTLIVDSNGLVQLDVSATVTGSGIGALVTEPNQPTSNINLMAPAGYVDAGEAGIRAQSGTVTLGTNLVLNAGNIQAASGVSGGAVVITPPPPAPPSTSTNAGDRVVEEAQREALAQQQAAAVQASQHSMRLIGEFIGFDSCAETGTTDIECSSGSDKKDQSPEGEKSEKSERGGSSK